LIYEKITDDKIPSQSILSKRAGKTMLPATKSFPQPTTYDGKHRAILRSLMEVLLWASLGLAAAWWMLAFRPAPLSNDSCQYLSVARNIRSGNGAATDLVYFDSERSHGRIPAPITTFPAGYPAAVGLFSRLVDSYETSARVLSALCFAGTAALLSFVLIASGVTAFVRASMVLLFITNFVSADYSAAVMSESMFVFIFTASIAALLWAWRDNQRPYVRVSWTIVGLSLAGLSYWIRYAGLFLIVAVVFYVGLRFLRLRHRIGSSELYATLIPIGLAGALMARNVLVSGTWRGGNELQVSNPLHRVLVDFVRAQMHLLFGEHAMTFGLWEVLLLAGVMGLCFLFVWLLLRDGLAGAAALLRVDEPWALLFTCATVYSAGLCYAGLRTVISFGTRMFLPVLPIYLLLLGLALHWLLSRTEFRGGQIWFRFTVCILVIGSIGVNARNLKDPRQISRQAYLSGLFAEPAADGQPLFDWVNLHIDPAAAIAAQDGQETGYLLNRRTLALVESEYSSERWECAEVRKQMDRFGASYLLLYRHPDHTSHLLEESRFAAQSVSGLPSCGFAVAAENSDVRILRIDASE
jgi:hypothetical protein